MSDGVRISSIEVLGNERINPSFFVNEIKAKKLNTTTFKSLEELNYALVNTVQQMNSRDLFENIEPAFMYHIKNHNADGEPEFDYSRVNIRLQVKEKRVLHGIINTYVQNGQSSAGAKVQAGFRSPYGFGEMIKIGGEVNPTGHSSYSADVIMPHIGPNKEDLSIIATRNDDDHRYYQSFREKSDSIITSMRSMSGRFTLSSIISARDEIPVKHHIKSIPQARDATFNILNLANSSTKFSLKCDNIWMDTRNESASPSQGSYIESNIEIALPPGNVQFIKSEINGQHTIPLGPSVLDQPGLTCTLIASAGLLVPFAAFSRYSGGSSGSSGSSGSGKANLNQQRNINTHLSDRFMLGGPLVLRGFDPCGIGARSFGGRQHLRQQQQQNSSSSSNSTAVPPPSLSSYGDSLGGISKFLITALFSVPLPFRDLSSSLSGIRAMYFMSAGTLGNPSYWNQYHGNKNSLSSNSELSLFGPLRVSTGVGISMSMQGQMRLEMSYSIPLIKAEHDLVRPFQLGIGLTVG